MKKYGNGSPGTRLGIVDPSKINRNSKSKNQKNKPINNSGDLFKPTITLNPISASYIIGNNIILEIAYIEGNPTETTIAWYKDDVLLSDSGRIFGSNTTTIFILSYEVGDNGIYYATVTNTAGTNTSTTAEVTTYIAPLIYFDAPTFSRSDFIVSSASNAEVDFSDSNIVGFIGTVQPQYIYREVNPDTFHGNVEYLNGLNPELTGQVFNTDQVNGIGLATGNGIPWLDPMACVTFFPMNGDETNSRYRIKDHNGNILYESIDYPSDSINDVVVEFDVTPLSSGTSYDLTIHLVIATLSIDETHIITDWTSHGTSSAKFVVFGPFYTDHLEGTRLLEYHTIEL